MSRSCMLCGLELPSFGVPYYFVEFEAASWWRRLISSFVGNKVSRICVSCWRLRVEVLRK